MFRKEKTNREEKISRKKKAGRWIIVPILVLLCLVFFAGCAGKQGIEGNWVLVEEIEPDGNKLSEEDLKTLGVSEEYVISGTEVKYTCIVPQLPKPIELTFDLKEIGKNEYEFNFGSGLTFASVKQKGNKMSYEVESEGGKSTMIFKRK